MVTKQMYLDKFILLRERKNVNEMSRKSFKLNTTVSNVTAVENILDRYGKFSDLHMASIAPDLIQLDYVGGVIDVANGWNQDRLSFIMCVAVPESNTKTSFYFLTGYTDYYMDTLSPTTSINQLDPNMIFKINSISLIEELVMSTGERTYKYIDEVSLLKGNYQNGYDSMLNDDYLIRPVDIMSRLDDYNQGTNLSAEATEVAKDNINPMTYVTKTLNIIQEGNTLTSNEGNYPKEIQMSEYIKNMVTISENKEPAIMKCPFILALYKTSEQVTLKPDSFTIPQLLKIFTYENVDSVTKLLLFKDELNEAMKYNYQKASIDNILDSENLGDAIQPCIENMIAMEFYYMISSAMFQKKITRAVFIVSNHGGYHKELVCQTMFASSYFHNGFANKENITYLDSYLKNIILNKLSKNNHISININADIDLLGKSSVAITVEGNQPVVYRYNSAMDNNFTPIVATGSSAESLTNDVSLLIDTVYSGNQY